MDKPLAQPTIVDSRPALMPVGLDAIDTSLMFFGNFNYFMNKAKSIVKAHVILN